MRPEFVLGTQYHPAIGAQSLLLRVLLHHVRDPFLLSRNALLAQHALGRKLGIFLFVRHLLILLVVENLLVRHLDVVPVLHRIIELLRAELARKLDVRVREHVLLQIAVVIDLLLAQRTTAIFSRNVCAHVLVVVLEGAQVQLADGTLDCVRYYGVSGPFAPLVLGVIAREYLMDDAQVVVETLRIIEHPLAVRALELLVRVHVHMFAKVVAALVGKSADGATDVLKQEE